MPERLAATFGHDLDRQAAVEEGHVLPLLEGDLVARQKGIDEGLVLLAIKRAVDVVGHAAARSRLVVAGLEPGDAHVDGFAVDDGGDRVEEGQCRLAGARQDGLRQRLRGQRAGGDDHAVPVRRRPGLDLRPVDGHQRLGGQCGGDGGRKAITVHRQRAAGRDLVGVGRPHDQRVHGPHLGKQQADGIGACVVGAERVGADELGQPVGVVGIGAAHRAHLVQHDRNTGARQLPGGFRSGKTATDDVNSFRVLSFDHPASLSHATVREDPQTKSARREGRALRLGSAGEGERPVQV